MRNVRQIMPRTALALILLLLCFASTELTAQPRQETTVAPPSKRGDYELKDFSITVKTQGFPGAKAYIVARLDAPVEGVWQAILDSNNHAGVYPRMKRSFCLEKEHVEESKQDKLRNGATIERRYHKKRCEPSAMRKRGSIWLYHLFQELDYPFPLSDRWMMMETSNDETGIHKGTYKQHGKLLYGRQEIYEFSLIAQSHPKYANQTQLTVHIWTDPGGIIMDWMVKEAAEIIAPKYIEITEKKGREFAGLDKPANNQDSD